MKNFYLDFFKVTIKLMHIINNITSDIINNKPDDITKNSNSSYFIILILMEF